MFNGFGLGGLGNLGSLIKKAQEMGNQMNKIGDELRHTRVVGAAGGGLVEVEVTGGLEVVRCKIDPSVAGDRELLEDLLVAAMNQALAKATKLRTDLLKEKTFGLPLADIHDMLVKSGALSPAEVAARTGIVGTVQSPHSNGPNSKDPEDKK